MGEVLDLLASGKPVIALVNVAGRPTCGLRNLPTALHYVVVTGYNRVNQTVTFMDTSGYQGSWSFAEFDARWNWQCSGVPGAFLDGLGVHPRTIIY